MFWNLKYDKRNIDILLKIGENGKFITNKMHDKIERKDKEN